MKTLNARGKLPLMGRWPKAWWVPETTETMATAVDCPWELEGRPYCVRLPGALVQDMKKQS